MSETKKPNRDLRKQHNADLLRRMRNGEPLNAIDSKASWYPPRPLIKKDAHEIARVYQGEAAAKSAGTTKRPANVRVLAEVPAPLSFDEAG